MFCLYRIKFFEDELKIKKRSFFLIFGWFMLFKISDFFGNEIMWGNCERIVRKYK